MKKEQHIPTIIGIIILILGLGATIFLIENGSRLFSQAAITAAPEKITITNITDTALSISWITEIPTIGTISYQEDTPFATARIAQDIRDTQETNKLPRYTHMISITDLSPKTRYTITILDGKRRFTDSRLTVTTGSVLAPPPYGIDPAFGTIVDTDNLPAHDMLVYASFTGSQILSTVTNEEGKWTVPLGSMRTDDLNHYFNPTPSASERIEFVKKDTASLVITTIDYDSPVPVIRVGETYDFTEGASLRPIIAQSQPFSQISGVVNAAFSVMYPISDSFIPSGKPAFSGTGIPGKEVIITINDPKPSGATTTITAAGTWNWSPAIALVPGGHTATITSFDKNNTPVIETVSFTILKSGTSVLGDATPSASMTPSPTPRITPSPSPIASPSGEPPVTGTGEITLLILALGAGGILFGTYGILFRKRAHHFTP